MGSSGTDIGIHSLTLSTQYSSGDRLKSGFGEAVAACDVPEPCEFPSPDSCQKRFLWACEQVYIAPHPAVGLVLQDGDTEKFLHALGFESLARLLGVGKQGPCLTTIEEDGSDQRVEKNGGWNITHQFGS